MTRSQKIWTTMYAALIMSVWFGLCENLFAALVCTWYPLAILILNMIAETRDEIKKARRCGDCEETGGQCPKK